MHVRVRDLPWTPVKDLVSFHKEYLKGWDHDERFHFLSPFLVPNPF